MIYRKTLQTTAQMSAWYDAKFTEMSGTWKTPSEEWNRHLDDFGVTVDKTKWLLDVGCGDGSFLIEAAKRVRVSGIDISQVAIDYAPDKTIPIQLGSIEDMSPYEFNYVVSLGSLEHVINLCSALSNIHKALTADGRWYFYLPNEKWTANDQPNERTATAEEWKAIFAVHGLIADHEKEWGACTAFWGYKE